MITRCGCTEDEKALPDWHGKHNIPCPKPRQYETMDLDRGTERSGGWTVDALKIECGCTDEEKAAPDWHGNANRPCPKPKGITPCELGATTVTTAELEILAIIHRG